MALEECDFLRQGAKALVQGNALIRFGPAKPEDRQLVALQLCDLVTNHIAGQDWHFWGVVVEVAEKDVGTDALRTRSDGEVLQELEQVKILGRLHTVAWLGC